MFERLATAECPRLSLLQSGTTAETNKDKSSLATVSQDECGVEPDGFEMMLRKAAERSIKASEEKSREEGIDRVTVMRTFDEELGASLGEVMRKRKK